MEDPEPLKSSEAEQAKPSEAEQAKLTEQDSKPSEIARGLMRRISNPNPEQGSNSEIGKGLDVSPPNHELKDCWPCMSYVSLHVHRSAYAHTYLRTYVFEVQAYMHAYNYTCIQTHT